MKELIEFIVRSLVDEPDRVEVRERDSAFDLELRVADADLGKIIGRRGKTAHAMRTLLRTAAPESERVELDIASREESSAE
jgi:predicted RNA-binding protein YlqC (UPF0109 family)